MSVCEFRSLLFLTDIPGPPGGPPRIGAGIGPGVGMSFQLETPKTRKKFGNKEGRERSFQNSIFPLHSCMIFKQQGFDMAEEGFC